MPTSFTSYWGSALHGVEIKWTSDASDSPQYLNFEFKSKYYWYMPHWYNSGQSGDVTINKNLGANGKDMKAYTDSN